MEAPMISIRTDPDTETLKALFALEAVRSDWQQPLAKLDMYLCGEQPLRFMTKSMEEAHGEALTHLVLNWAELVTQSYENRLDVEGFRFPGEPSGSADLWAVWQANNMDEKSQMGHFDAMGLSRAAVIVGPPRARGDAPLITIEAASDVAWIRDPATRAVRRALKAWVEEDYSRWWTIYRPGRRTTLVRDSRGLSVADELQHDIDASLLEPLVHFPRIRRPDGRSIFASVVPVADAANKMATDMMISGEYHAMPRRWAFGLKADDFKDKSGLTLPSWSAIAGRLWAHPNKDVKVGTFPEADLSNFHNTIKLLAQLAGQLAALPPHYLSFVSDNPASADAIRSTEAQMVKRVERAQTSFGGCWEQVMRLVLRIQSGDWDEKARALETVWREPSTPTIAQKADATVKLATATTPNGLAILPLEQARIDLGYTDAQRREMRQMDEADPELSIVRDLTNGVA